MFGEERKKWQTNRRVREASIGDFSTPNISRTQSSPQESVGDQWAWSMLSALDSHIYCEALLRTYRLRRKGFLFPPKRKNSSLQPKITQVIWKI